MNQPTFADLDYESKKRKTRREKFLERMDGLIPWEELEERRSIPNELSVMLRNTASVGPWDGGHAL